MTDYNILKWYDSIDEQEFRKWYAYNNVPIIPVEINQIPPFQLIRSKTGAAITRFDLVSFKTGVSTDILSEITTAGLEVLEPVGKTYDIIFYPATIRLSLDFDQGGYYAIMSDGTNTWYSEVFTMTAYLGDHIKVEWCHNRDFEYPDGHIQYTTSNYGNGYKNYIWIDTDIAKPKYVYEREVVNRDGHVFPRKQIKKKQYRFEYICPESIIDTLSVVELHDVVSITAKTGQTLNVNEFEMEEPEWITNGNLAAVTINFVTDKVVVPIYANGVASGTCDIAPGTCFPATGNFFIVKSKLIKDGANWVAGTYLDSEGVSTALVANEYVTAEDGGIVKLYQFNAPDDYTFIDNSTVVSTFWVENTNEYLFDLGEGAGIQSSEITSYTTGTNPPTFTGVLHPQAIGEILFIDAGGAETFATTLPIGTDLSTGIQVEVPAGSVSVVLKHGSVKCGMFYESIKTLEDIIEEIGIGFWQVSTTLVVQ